MVGSRPVRGGVLSIKGSGEVGILNPLSLSPHKLLAFKSHVLSDPKSGHYPGAVNIPFPSLFNPETRTLKTVDELKKGELFSK